jgi:hypothetical protein
MSAASGNPKSWPSTLLAFAIYQALAILWFGTPLLSDFSHTYIGIQASSDPGVHMWLLTWWPYAISHHLNLLLTKAIWAPSGYNLAWATSIPFPALAAAPITELWGPVFAWNVLCLMSPALAAWCAFILCRHLCRAFLPALTGGYLFGFSPYMLGHLLGHLSLILVFPVPLAVYLVVIRMEARLSRPAFVSLLTVLILTTFLCSQELLATTAVVGALAMTLALFTAGSTLRRDLLDVCVLTAMGFGIAMIFLMPYLYYAFSHGYPSGPINPPDLYSSDLLAFLVPTPALLIGQPPAIASLAQHLVGGWAEDTAYIGIPLLLIILDYGLTKWREARARAMLLALAVIALASLGPWLHIAGNPTIALPWLVAMRLPLLDKALPARFMMFAFLDAGLITAIYLAGSPHRTRKWILALLAVVSLTPNLPAGWWFSKLDTPRFFAEGAFRRYLARDEITLILPYGREGNSMLWQAQAGMYFRMAGGYAGLTPPEFARWPAVNSLFTGAPCFDFAQQLKFFLATHGVKTIVLARDARRMWPDLLKPLNMNPIEVEDVTLYRVPPEFSAKYSAVDAHEAATSAALGGFAALVAAADSYWRSGLPLSKLNPWEAERLGLLALPPTSAKPVPNNEQWWSNLWLGPLDGSTVGIGVTGVYSDLEAVVDKYGPLANEIQFPYPDRLHPGMSSGQAGQLLMTFDRKGLTRAASIANPSSRVGRAPLLDQP